MQDMIYWNALPDGISGSCQGIAEWCRNLHESCKSQFRPFKGSRADGTKVRQPSQIPEG